MKSLDKVRIFSVLAALAAVLLLAGPGYSDGGRDEADHGRYYTSDHPGQDLEIQQVGDRHRRRGHRVWRGYYGAPHHGYYYGPRYYGPSVTFGYPYAYPYPYVAPGVSVHIGL
ncbi:MAG: hypothetical protein AB9873_08585 [Syntrophobacteraceae bacterium]